MQSQQMHKMSSSSPNAGMQASAPLVVGIINHVLCSPTQTSTSRSLNFFTSFTFFLVDTILHHSPNLVIYWVEIWAIQRPQIRRDECEHLLIVSHALYSSALSCWNTSHQTPAVWQVTNVDSEAPHGSNR